jgi:ankyrin repeat protein
MKAMKTKSILAALLVAATLSHAQTNRPPSLPANDLTAALQRGLFEEEGNRDLEAAISAYQSLATQFDKSRQVAATAIFRLGECYRKLGRTNEAVAQYERIVREFTDQQTLATLSRQNLTGLSVTTSERPTIAETSSEAEHLAAQLAAIDRLKEDPAKQARAVFAIFPDDDLKKMLFQLPRLQEQDAWLKANTNLSFDLPPGAPSSQTPFRPLYIVREPGGDLIETGEGGVGPGIRTSLQRHLKSISERIAFIIDNQRARLQVLQAMATNPSGSSPRAQGSSAAYDISAVTDDEEKEIRRIQGLIRNSPDLINAQGEGGNTPLISAASKGQLSVAKFLLDSGADVSRRNNTGQMALHVAAGNGHKAMAELLLRHGADVNAGGDSDRTALQDAMRRGYEAVIEVLLAAKPDVNRKDRSGYTALHTAMSTRRPPLVEKILALGADVQARDNSQKTALHLTAQKDIIELLIASKAEVNAKDANGSTPLHTMIGSAPIVEVLLKSGADVNAQDKNGNTALHQAVGSGSSDDVMKLLLNPKPNLEIADAEGFTPLQRAYLAGRVDPLKLLLDAGANLNVAASAPRGSTVGKFTGGSWSSIHQDGNTLLHWAAQFGEDDVMAALLKHGAEPNARNQNGMTPLHLAAEVGRQKAAELLLAAQANVNALSAGEYTPLLLAVMNRKADIVDLLLRNKADPNLRSSAGQTPLDFAKQQTPTSGGQQTPTTRIPLPGRIPTPGTLGAGAVQNQIATGSPPQASIADLLRQHGALEEVPKLDRIQVKRPSANFDSPVFFKGTNDWNRFTLLQVIYNFYKAGSTTWSPAVIAKASSLDGRTVVGAIGNLDALPFPDLTRVVVVRQRPEAGKPARQQINLFNGPNRIDCSRDMVLEFGDVVEIPERLHSLEEARVGLTPDERDAILNCLKGTVQLVAGDRKADLPLFPTHSALIGNQLGSPDARKVLYSSSDLSRVKVTRKEPASGQILREWILDCSNPNNLPDLWLRNGDVIEVPEK